MVETKGAPARFKLPLVHSNRYGWGPEPGNEPEQFKELPFCPFGKGDRLGKAADFVQTGYQRNPYRGRRGQYEDANKFVNEALLSGMPDVDDSKFTRVDSSAHRKPDRFRQRDRRRMQRGSGRFKDQKQLGGDDRGRYSGGRNSYGGGRRPGGNDFRRNRHMRIDRAPTVNVDASWKLIDEFNLADLKKLKVETPKTDEVEDLEWCGFLDTYNDEYERLRARPKPLDFTEKVIFFFVNTVDDPKIRQFGAERKGNVYTTDAILSHLMASPRSVIPWDVVVEKNEFGLFFYKRNEDANIDLISVNENSPNPPLPRDDHDDPPNSAERLSGEATVINWKFSQQILKRGPDAQRKEFENPHPFFESDVAEEGSHPAAVAYRYRRFPLGNHNIVVRTELHGLVKTKADESLYMTAYALNEWEKDEWRRKIDQQPGAILTSEITNNGFKLHKWTAQSVLAGADIMKLGFVTRNPSRLNRDEHLVLSTQNVKPALFAKNMLGTSVENMWGIVKMIVDKFMRDDVEEGKYIMVRDPNKPVVRIYNVPPETFESDDDDDEEEDGDDKNGGNEGEGNVDLLDRLEMKGGSIYTNSRPTKKRMPSSFQPQYQQHSSFVPSYSRIGGTGFNGYPNQYGHHPQHQGHHNQQRGNPHGLPYRPQLSVRNFINGPGLRNLGNTCYLNCILQVMIHCHEIWKEIEKQPHRAGCHVQGFCVLCELEDLMRKARMHPPNNRQALEPTKIARNIRKIAPHFSIDHQEDAHEFLRTFIDAMQRCCPPFSKELAKECKPYPFSLFAGSLVSKVRCTVCHNVSETVDPIEDVVLEIQQCHSVEDGLKRFTGEETLDGSNMYRCEKCNKHVKAVKSIGLREVPKVLAIQLKRFSHESFGRKINRHIEFKEKLSLDPYVGCDTSHHVGELFAVVVHSGHSVDAGHYFSYIKANNDFWYEMNDENVNRVHRETVMRCEAYILFYVVTKTERRSPPSSFSSSSSYGSSSSRDMVGPTQGGQSNPHASTDKLPFLPTNVAAPSQPAAFIGPSLPPGFVRRPHGDEEKPPPRPVLGPRPLGEHGNTNHQPTSTSSSNSNSKGSSSSGSSAPSPAAPNGFPRVGGVGSSFGLNVKTQGQDRTPLQPPPPPPLSASSITYRLDLKMRDEDKSSNTSGRGGASDENQPHGAEKAKRKDTTDAGDVSSLSNTGATTPPGRVSDHGVHQQTTPAKKRKLCSGVDDARAGIMHFIHEVINNEPKLLNGVTQQLHEVAIAKVPRATTPMDVDGILKILKNGSPEDPKLADWDEGVGKLLISRVMLSRFYHDVRRMIKGEADK